MLLAEKAGIERKTAVEVLTHSVIASPMVVYRGPMVLGLPDEAWFVPKLPPCDWALIPPTTAIANEFLSAARGAGLEKKDFAAVFHLLAQLSGVTP